MLSTVLFKLSLNRICDQIIKDFPDIVFEKKLGGFAVQGIGVLTMAGVELELELGGTVVTGRAFWEGAFSITDRRIDIREVFDFSGE